MPSAMSTPPPARTDVFADVAMAVETPEHVAIEYPLAGLGSRYCALLIDGVIVVLAILGGLFGLGWMLRTLEVRLDLELWSEAIGVVALLWLFAVQWGYFFCLEAFADGRTYGKRLLGLRAVMEGGHPLTLEAAAIRNLVRPIDLIGAGMVGGFSMLLTRRLQRLGDLAAGSVVVRELPSAFPVVGDATAAAGVPLLDGETFAALETYVDRRAELGAEARARVAGLLAARVGERVPYTPGDDDAFLQSVHADERGRRLTSPVPADTGRPAALRLLRTKRARWEEFRARALVARRRGLAALPEHDVAEFAARYRELTADLARARTYGASPGTLFALERLVGLGHNVLYRPARRSSRAAWQWLAAGFPALVRRRWRPMALAALCLFAPAVLAYALVRTTPELEDRLLASDMLARAEAAPARQRAGSGYIDASEAGAVLSSMLTTNNVTVAFTTFAAGVLAGLGSLVVMVVNGLHLGSVLAAYANRDVLALIATFVLPHGVVELTAIAIAGGAGLWMGSGLLLPGRLTRAAALAARAREAVSLVAGVCMLLLVAGLIEGYVSPAAMPAGAKLAVAALAAGALAAYLTLAGAAPPVTPDRDA